MDDLPSSILQTIPHQQDYFELNPKCYSISSVNILYASLENEDYFKKHNHNIITTPK